MSIGIEDVARRAGVSIATVSRVLADKPHVSSKARKVVLDAVQELGYRPNLAARNLRSRKSNRLGLIISDIQNPFFTALVRAVEDVAFANEYTVILCNTDEDPERESLYVNLMVSEQVAGVILSPAESTIESLHNLAAAQIPVVLVDRDIPEATVDSVLVESQRSTARLITHLVDKGHTRIGAVIGSTEVSTGRERQEGYRQALQMANLPIAPELVRIGVPKEDVGYSLTQELLTLNEPPTALFTGSSLLTLGALRAIHEHRLSIPEQIALVAFDEMDWMFVMQPPLTVVAQPIYEMGEKAAQLILKRIADPKMASEHIVLEPTLLFRGSSGGRR